MAKSKTGIRMYEGLWIKIRSTAGTKNIITINAPPHLHNRIIKAVIKEKNLDPWSRKNNFRLAHEKSGEDLSIYLVPGSKLIYKSLIAQSKLLH